MLYQVNFALDNTEKAITLLTEDFIPRVLNLEAFLFETDVDKYNQSKKIFSYIIGKSLDLEAQIKGTMDYIEWIYEDYAKKVVAIPATLQIQLNKNLMICIACIGLSLGIMKQHIKH